MNADVKEL